MLAKGDWDWRKGNLRVAVDQLTGIIVCWAYSLSSSAAMIRRLAISSWPSRHLA